MRGDYSDVMVTMSRVYEVIRGDEKIISNDNEKQVLSFFICLLFFVFILFFHIYLSLISDIEDLFLLSFIILIYYCYSLF